MRKLSVFVLSVLFSSSLSGQEDLMSLLNQNADAEKNFTSATFKSTRIMNGHSIERMPPGQLDFRISHRFGTINSGLYNLFGLDLLTNVHFSLEYGILNWLMVGFGRGTYEKTFDGFAKFSILRQSTGERVMPVSVSLFSSAALRSMKWEDPAINNYFSSRLSYTTQLLIARKISPAFSFQVTPTYVHRNLVASETDPNDLYAVGAGGRIKLTRRISLNAEYFLLLNANNVYFTQAVYNPLSLGFDIETGGHVFQLIFTNSLAMIEKGFIGETTGRWKHGDIHFGFNISRVFTLKKPPLKPNKDQ
jgi:hypothetical protein